MDSSLILQGYIERITFHNYENSFTVAKLQEEGAHDLVTLVGEMPSIKVGETLRVVGCWIQSKIHGKQFQVEKLFYYTPTSKEAIQKYLESGLIKGLGPKYAKNIIDRFGDESLKVIDERPYELLKVEGIGKKRVESVIHCWAEQKTVRKLILFLQQFHISPNLAQKIFKKLGSKALEILNENPYALASAIRGIGFKTADTLAQKMGIAKNSPSRLQEGILFALSELAQEGHMCYEEQTFIQYTKELLEVDESLIAEQIPLLDQEEKIIRLPLPYQGNLKPFIWLRGHYIVERGMAKEFSRIKKGEATLRAIEGPKALQWAQEHHNLELAEKQKEAILRAIDQKFSIITGGPGTGKSTITQLLISIYKQIHARIQLAAPTGKAAKRLSEITKENAKTIHAMLEYDFKIGGFKKNPDSPLECDLLIIDEASMIDSFLMYQLLRALPTQAKVVLIGDTHQLPSVGPGNVLKDFIESQKVPYTFLKDIFRQAQCSQIVTNAHLINQGKFPQLYSPKDGDFFFVEAKDKEALVQTLTHLNAIRIPKKFHFDPLKDIQVLSPMRKGVIGCDQLNLSLQRVLNPQSRDGSLGIKGFFKGDKVMQLKNNYQKEVFNGDVGYIQEVSKSSEELWVEIDGKRVHYSFSELEDLSLAYAVSVHKFQGSECPCILIPIHQAHFMMLQRNLIYTALTRGRKLVVILGTKQAIAMGVKNDKVKQRFTGLRHALEALVPFDLAPSSGAKSLGMWF